ncbi:MULTISPECIES: MFS transporter [Photorhabdus]|uniref:MFS transporter n=1 Tax=Photorhabdus bodei TaxID=2029681 RepID=A0AAW6BQM8_9GAMM|nr:MULTISPECIES: MFS transporter [Photorhabdus]MCC8465468.1 MFS transporter [Photorhabdus bodei]MCT8353840.1 MFS transporter [Photorhabdus kayaii]MDB6370096.1 MFS transporter [Photorhabdus bodei]MDB6374314.1 MFS transporter [Photorhabdus bodei]
MPPLMLKLLPIILIIGMVPSFIEVDITLPAFPQMLKFFSATESAVQFTLIVNFLGLCIFTPIFGPLSESYGRRKIILIGATLFFIGSIGCSTVVDLNQLYLFRFIQGVGCSAIWIVGFIICSDTYKDEESVQVFGILNAAISMALIIAPIAGSLIVAHYNWRFTYHLVALLSFLSFIAVLIIPETNRNTIKLSVKMVTKSYCQLIFNTRFLIYAFTPGLLVSACIAYVSVVPFLYIDKMGMSYYIFAVHQAILGICLSVAGFYSGALNRKIGSANCIYLSIIICLIGCGSLMIFSHIYPESAILFTLSMAVICIGSAFQYSMVFSRSLALYPELVGSASSLLTFFRLIFFSFSVLISGWAFTGKLFNSAIIVSLIIAMGLLFSFFVLIDLRNNVVNRKINNESHIS